MDLPIETSHAYAAPIHLQAITASSKARVFRQLAAQIPLNEYRLPVYLLDSQALFTQNSKSADQSCATSSLVSSAIPQNFEYFAELANSNIVQAVINLNYEEGYPLVESTGNPIWEPLPDEDPQFIDALRRYVMMPYESLATEDSTTKGNFNNANVYAHAYMRSLKHIAQTTAELQDLYMHATLHHWASRARAYDLFRLAADTKRREQLQREQEYTQYHNATNLVAQSIALIQAMLADPSLYEVKPSDAIRLYQIALKAQRTSIGLPESGPLKENNTQVIQDLPTLIRQIAEASPNPNANNHITNEINSATIEQLEQLFFSQDSK